MLDQVRSGVVNRLEIRGPGVGAAFETRFNKCANSRTQKNPKKRAQTYNFHL